MTPPNDAEALGQLVAERYRLDEVIGGGGMGVVYRGRDTRIENRPVAVKLLVPSGELDSDAGARFDREARIMGRLSHPNVVAILDTGHLEDGRPFIVMEHLAGENLAERIARGPLGLDEMIEVLTQVARGLDAAHAAGVVHRDLKPHNIFLCGDGGDLAQVKVLDFGISKLVGSMTMRTETTQIVGTPQYMAPEQARGEHEMTSPRSDVFALGVIAYELASGVRPFDGQMLHEVIFRIIDHRPEPLVEIADVPEAFSNAVAVAMAKSPIDRFASAGAFVRALTGEEPIDAETLAAIAGSSEAPTINARPRPAAPTAETSLEGREAAPRPGRRRWWIAGVIAAAIAGAGLAAARLRDPVMTGPRVAELARAYNLGDAARAKLAAGRSREALVDLSQAYRDGDRRLATRIALADAMVPADALIASLESPLIDSANISAAGDRLAVATEGEIRVYDRAGRKLASRAIDRSGPLRVVFTEDRLIAADRKGFSVFDRQLERELQRVDGAELIHVLPDDGIIYSTESNAAKLRYVRLALGSDKPVWTKSCLLPAVASRGWAIDAKVEQMAICVASNLLISIESGETIAEIPNDVRQMLALGGGRLIGIGGDGRARLYGAGEPIELADFPKQLGGAVLSSDGSFFAMLDRGRLELRRVDVDARFPVVRTFGGDPITAMRFAPDNRLAFADKTGLIRVIDCDTGTELMRGEQLEAVDELLVSESGDLVSKSQRRVRSWRLDGGRLSVVARTDIAGVRMHGDALVFEADDALWLARGGGEPAIVQKPAQRPWLVDETGRYLAAGNQLIDLEGGARVALPERWRSNEIAAGAAVISGKDGQAPAVLARDGDGYRRLELGERVVDVRADRAGRRVALVRGEGKERRMEVRDLAGALLASRPAPDEFIGYFIRDDTVASIIASGVRLWRWQSGELADLGGVKFPLVQTGGPLVYWLDRGLHRVDLDQMARAGVERPCPRALSSVRASPDLALLICDERAVVWSLEDRREVLSLDERKLGSQVFISSIAPDGSAAVMASVGDALFRLELDAERRPPAVIDALITRLNGVAP